MAAASYQVQLDINRDSTYAADLTTYVLALDWNHGLANALDSMAPPARLAMTLDNSGGEFNQETLGGELLTHGDFSSWSGGNPVGWTVTGESGSDPEVSEVGPSKTHGSGGNGLANLYTSGAALSISQTILTVGARYKATLTMDGVSGAGGVALKTGSTAVSPVYHAPGMKTVTFTASSTTFAIATDGAANVTLDNVSVKPAGVFGGALRPETLVRIRATFNAVAYTLYTGRIAEARLTPGNVGARRCTVLCDDPLRQMAEADYAPPLQTGVTIDAALSQMLDLGMAPWPYAGAYWLLEAEGSSELGTTTTLFNAVTSFETAKTTLAFIGDNANRADGAKADQFIRALLAAEAGGRLWFDARQGQFMFTNRHHDLDSVSAAASYTADDYDEAAPAAYGDLAMNDVTVHYQPREVGAPGTVLWTEPAVIALQPRHPRKIIARYYDAANNTDALIGGINMIAPEPYSDYTAEVQFSTSADGGVTTTQSAADKVTLPQDATTFSQITHLVSDRTRRLVISVAFGASSAEISLHNSSGHRVFYVTSLRLRGTPLRTFDRRSAVSRDGASIRAVGEQKRVFDLPQVDDDDFAQAIADFAISRFKDPTTRLPSVTLIANKSDARMTAALTRTIGDRITIADDFLGHTLDYIIIGERHQITAGGEHTHCVTWTLEPANTIVYWKLGTASFGELGQNTRLML